MRGLDVLSIEDAQRIRELEGQVLTPAEVVRYRVLAVAECDAEGYDLNKQCVGHSLSLSLSLSLIEET